MKNAFGGSLLYRKRKSKRELSYEKSTHMTLRLKPLLPSLFEPHDDDLRRLIFEKSKKYNIRVYDLILNHTHMHAVLLLPNREAYNGFIREVTSSITLHFSNKLDFLGTKLKKIFTYRPFTRFVHWGREFKKLKEYMKKNEMESGVLQNHLNEEWHQKHRARVHTAQLVFGGLEPP